MPVFHNPNAELARVPRDNWKSTKQCTVFYQTICAFSNLEATSIATRMLLRSTADVLQPMDVTGDDYTLSHLQAGPSKKAVASRLFRLSAVGLNGASAATALTSSTAVTSRNFVRTTLTSTLFWPTRARFLCRYARSARSRERSTTTFAPAG